MVAVPEGDSISVSCISTGEPVPSVLWTLNNKTTNFNQTDIISQSVLQPDDIFVSNVILGSVISTLVDAEYPTHDGVYICTGRNSLEATVNNTILVNGTKKDVGMTKRFSNKTLGRALDPRK